jgi:hypothetical protein
MTLVRRILARADGAQRGTLRPKPGLARRAAESGSFEEPQPEAEIDNAVQAVRRATAEEGDEARTLHRSTETESDSPEEGRALRRAAEVGGDVEEGEEAPRASRVRRAEIAGDEEVAGLDEGEPPEELANEPPPSDARAQRRDTEGTGSLTGAVVGHDALVGHGRSILAGPKPASEVVAIGAAPPAWVEAGVGPIGEPLEPGPGSATAPSVPRPEVTIEQVDVTIREPESTGGARVSPFQDRARLIRARFARRF